MKSGMRTPGAGHGKGGNVEACPFYNKKKQAEAAAEEVKTHDEL
jgi:hypothetical protein